MTHVMAALPLLVALSIAQPIDPSLEREAKALEAMLIAPCCFSQQVSVHQSSAADEVRKDVRRRLAAGETRQQILDAYTAQYGKRILAEPPAEGFDITLYVLPVVMLAASLGFIMWIVRRLVRPAAANDDASVGDAPEPQAVQYSTRLDDELRDMD